MLENRNVRFVYRDNALRAANEERKRLNEMFAAREGLFRVQVLLTIVACT